jgi:hypothetical protein
MPYKILAGLLLLLAVLAAAEYDGYKRSEAKWSAKALATERIANELYRAEVARGNALSEQLAKTESSIIFQTIERIKYVPKVTTGKPCLSADAVRLLNNGSETSVSEASGESTSKGSGASASDTDVATWAIEAHQYYDVCAARLNTLVDFEEGRAQP